MRDVFRIFFSTGWRQQVLILIVLLASGFVEVIGIATEFVRAGDQGARFRFHFCPVCGSTVFHTEEGVEGSVGVAVGGFGDPDFPPPQDSVYTCRMHGWVRLPQDVRAYDRDPM